MSNLSNIPVQMIRVSKRPLCGVPELKFVRETNVIQIEQFPRPPFETLQLSEKGL